MITHCRKKEGNSNKHLKIAINAQIISRNTGGVESALIGLIHALGQLGDGSEEYIIIGPWQEPDWPKPYMGPNQRIVRGLQPTKRRGPLDLFKRALGPLRPLGRTILRGLFPPPPRSPPQVPVSDGFYESLECDVIHFPFQHFVLCALPTIYNPHDLQHRHYPQFFTPSAIARRESIYPAGCHLAHTIVVGSHWVRQDVMRHYRVDPNKIQVIPWAPPTQAYSNPAPEVLVAVKAKYDLDLPFAFYPSMTWEHKNHLRLLEALVHLRDREGLVVRLVCTGYRYPRHWPRIKEQLHTLNLDGQVRFLDMVPPEDLRAIYRLAQFVVVPTLFEAASGPVFEAWQEETPVTCSTVTSLPEQVGDAALLFDPFSVEDIAYAVRRMATEPDLCTRLQSKGQRRLQDFSWEHTAKAYRAVYRRAARCSLTGEDSWLLSWDWMRNSKPPKRGAQ